MWLATPLTSRSSGRGRPAPPSRTSPFPPSARRPAAPPPRHRHARRRLYVPVLPPEHPAGRDLDQRTLEEERQGEALAEEEIDGRLLGPPQRQGPRPRLLRGVPGPPRGAPA